MKLLYSILIIFAINLTIDDNSARANDEVPLLEFDSIVFPEVASMGMVTSQEARATEVGVKILEQGGNAVDAAVAVGFTLAVTLPRAGNIGGGGFMLIYDAKKQEVNALDYREKAPMLASEDMFLNWRNNVDQTKARYSLLSSGVPGTVAGLVEAHKKYGSLPFEKLVQPAIELAKGMPMTYALSQSLNSRKQFLSFDQGSREIFIKPDGKNWQVGEQFKQENLAQTLSLIAETEGRDFYHGKTAKKIADYFKKNDGLMTLSDLKAYKAVWRKPVSTNFKGYDIYSMPPPSSGGTHLIQLLNIIKEFSIENSGASSARTSHLKTQAMKYVYADRSEYLGDPDFVSVPVERLTSQTYAKEIAKKIDLKKATSSANIKPGLYIDKESSQTTHFSVMDKNGNIVSNTYTLNFSFGSGKSIPEVGFLLNNEMDDFSAKPGSPNGYGLIGGEANKIEPGKRPLSSMTPVIALNRGKPWLATGSPGGSKIITTVFNFLLNRIVYNMNIAEATITPRIHHQWYPDTLFLEKGYPFDSMQELKTMGHNVIYRKPWGSLQSIEFQSGVFMGFADTRRPGALAKGYYEQVNESTKNNTN